MNSALRSNTVVRRSTTPTNKSINNPDPYTIIQQQQQIDCNPSKGVVTPSQAQQQQPPPYSAVTSPGGVNTLVRSNTSHHRTASPSTIVSRFSPQLRYSRTLTITSPSPGGQMSSVSSKSYASLTESAKNRRKDCCIQPPSFRLMSTTPKRSHSTQQKPVSSECNYTDPYNADTLAVSTRDSNGSVMAKAITAVPLTNHNSKDVAIPRKILLHVQIVAVNIMLTSTVRRSRLQYYYKWKLFISFGTKRRHRRSVSPPQQPAKNGNSNNTLLRLESDHLSTDTSSSSKVLTPLLLKETPTPLTGRLDSMREQIRRSNSMNSLTRPSIALLATTNPNTKTTTVAAAKATIQEQKQADSYSCDTTTSTANKVGNSSSQSVEEPNKTHAESNSLYRSILTRLESM
eukprot:PhF_6_TR43667/c0_g1_i1/m.67103